MRTGRKPTVRLAPVDSLDEARARLSRLDRAAGTLDRDLTLGDQTIRFEGLSEALASAIDARWGGFASTSAARSPRLIVRAVRSDDGPWLRRWSAGERYRLEADASGGPLIVRSYHFALSPEVSGSWRLAICGQDREPIGRVLDNAARYLVARIALEAGGLALHGAGVLRGGRAWIFAGVSGAGKSTAAGVSSGTTPLGDDFAVVLPEGVGWATHAVPFDNTEKAPDAPVRGLVPLAGVLRLFKAPTHRIEQPAGVIAQASLMSCAAFPWALPDLAERAEDAVARISASGAFRHLHFAQDAGFWSLLDES